MSTFSASRQQRGSSLLVVLVLLTVLLVGALSMARMTESSTLIAGNISTKNGAMQASEVGVTEAFIAIQAIANVEANVGTWYFASQQADDAAGMPAGIDWTKAPTQAVGQFQVAYVVDRLCTAPLPVTNPNAQCVLKKMPAAGSAKAGIEALDSPAATEYRVTVSVTGPKSTQTFVQALAFR